jgi:hypothetical protein
MSKKKFAGVERRKFQRLEIPLKVHVTILTDEEVPGGPRTLEARSRNISQTGICIETRQIEVDGVPMLSGSPGSVINRLDLTIELYPEQKPLKVVGEVCWYDLSDESEQFMFKVGIIFLEFESNGEMILQNFLKSLEKKKGGFFARLLGRP